MKVGRYYSNRDVRVEEMPVPRVGPRDLLIRVEASGICGSDIMEWYRIKRAPLVLGHEIAGEVVEVGAEITRWKAGDRVFATHHVPCDGCHFCLGGHQTACETFHTTNNFTPGGFAEYVRVTGRSVDTGTLRLPEGVSFSQGSFVEPLGTVVRGLRALDLRPGDSVLVLGAGVAGLLMISLARAMGAGRIMATDLLDFRLAAACKAGAERVARADADIPAFVREVNGGRLADKVILAAGALSAARQALASVERGGTVLLFAVPRPGETVEVDFNPYWRNDVAVRTSYGAAPLDNEQALELIRAGRVEVESLVTHRFGLSRIGEGFQAASEGRDSLKIIIEPHRRTEAVE